MSDSFDIFMRKTDPNFFLYSRFLLGFACMRAVVQLRDLHMQGYSLLSIDATGQTALHYSSKYGYKDIVKYLISYAPNSIINMVDNTT